MCSKGDAGKAYAELGWKSNYTMPDVVRMMVQAELKEGKTRVSTHRSAASVGEMWALELIQQIERSVAHLDVEDTDATAGYSPNVLQSTFGECRLGAA